MAATGNAGTEAPARFHQAVLRLLKELYFSLYGVALLISLFASVGLFVTAALSSGTVQTIWLGLATSLLASAVYSALFLLFTSEVEERLLRATVAHEMHQVAAQVTAHATELQRRYIPVTVYEEGDHFDPRFNRDLNDDLATTATYVYYGLTGSYVGARLCRVNHRINDVRVIVGDPMSDAAILTRMLHAYARPDPNAGPDEIRRELEADVDRCVIGLFQSRRLHDNIELFVTPSPNFDRLEICDAAAYLTLFSTRDDQTKTFPETLKFSAKATFYAMMLRDARRAEHAPGVKVLRVRAETSRRDLAEFYDRAFGRRLSNDDLASMEQQFRAFRDDFSRKLRQLEPDGDGAASDSDGGRYRRMLEGYRAARDRLRGR
ncbi:MAG: hypothetical protein ACRD2C_08120 [Acidimicrobiales bacterium]